MEIFNRKERLMMNRKLKRVNGLSYKTPPKKINWRSRNDQRKRQRDQQLEIELESFVNSVPSTSDGSDKPNLLRNQNHWYSLNIALPGSILNNVQSSELRAYVAGEIARTCAIFCVDEIVIFDETAQMTQEQIDSYYSGEWKGEEYLSEYNIECNFHLARILEYLECPQYLRKTLFPIQKPLKFAGLLNPLESMHHLRANQLDVPYREGIVLDRPVKNGKGPLCDVGLNKNVQLSTETSASPFTRVTVKIDSDKGGRLLSGSLTNARKIRRQSGIYWGYKVRIAKSLSDVLSKQYDFVIGTSERGKPVNELPIAFTKKCRFLIVFGGLNGLEAAVQADGAIAESDPGKYFPNYLNCLVDQGTRTIRTEEAIPISLTTLKYRLNELSIS